MARKAADPWEVWKHLRLRKCDQCLKRVRAGDRIVLLVVNGREWFVHDDCASQCAYELAEQFR